MNTNIFKILILVLLFFFAKGLLFSQEIKDTTSTDEILVYNSDNTKILKYKDRFIRHLNGNVKIYHDSTYFFADTAILDDKQFYAYGNIVIIQHDSIKIFSDTLIYNGDSLKAELIDKVVMENGKKTLKTNHLYYDVHNKIARYNTGAELTQKTSKLTSVKGVYKVNKKKIKFSKYVAINDSSFVLHTDSLDFDTEKRIAYFLAKTLIEQDSSIIYCEDGYYNIKTGNALFEKNMTYKKNMAQAIADRLYYIDSLSQYVLIGDAQYTEDDIFSSADTIIHSTKINTSTLIGHAIFKSKTQSAVGNKIVYNHDTESFIAEGRSTIIDEAIQITAENTDYSKKTGEGEASGDVEFIDTVANIVINSSKMFMKKDSNYMLAYGDTSKRLLMRFIDKSDTTYMSADTIISMNIVKGVDTTKVLKGYYNVRIYNKDYQAIADSLSYFPDDSLYVLYSNPVLWSDSTQITGDTISIFSKNNGIDKIYARNSGFITNIIAENLYNQIKGVKVMTYFKNDSINNMNVDGNAETIYHMKNEKQELTGTVKTICSKIKFEFKNNKVKNIKFFGTPKSDLIPIKKEILSPHLLDGFNWYDEYRPKAKYEVLILVKKPVLKPKIKIEEKSDSTKGVGKSVQ